jgi:hypothetical protein
MIQFCDLEGSFQRTDCERTNARFNQTLSISLTSTHTPCEARIGALFAYAPWTTKK